uniref:Conserved oligomeric Golgi complex subunit 3 n=3 Tax=Hirondellea gigas TaxID=1518452 RepID=A0A6A7G0E7_9CRUS
MEDVADVSIRKARENLLKWEDLNTPIAPISTEVRETVIELLSVTGNRPYSSAIVDTSSKGRSATDEGVTEFQHEIEDNRLVLNSAEQFLSWFNNVEKREEEEGGGMALSSEAARSVKTYGIISNESSSRSVMLDYVQQLNSHRTECQALLQQLDAALHHLSELQAQYTSVSTRTTALHTDCEHLLAEQTRLSNKAETIQAKLWYFTQVDSISLKLTSPVFSVTSEGFIPLLAKIDQCIAYMKNNAGCRESSVYLVRYMHCLSRALGLIRLYVTKSLQNSTRQVIPKPGEIQPNSDNATVLYYSKFRTNAPRIKSLMSEIENRLVEARDSFSVDSLSISNGHIDAFRQLSPPPSLHHQSSINSRNNSVQNLEQQQSVITRSLSQLYKHNQSDAGHVIEYQNLLHDCHQCFFRQRRLLLVPCVNDAITQLVSNYRKDHCSLVRSGCAFLVHVCEDEHSLYSQFFSLPSPDLDDFLDELCTALYDGLRPLIIHIDHLETLSELCSILRRGMIEEHLQSNPVQLSALRRVVTRMLEDSQERLVYRSHVYISTDIAGFVASPGDLAYPGKLEMMEQIAQEIAASTRAARLASRGHGRTNSDASSMVSINSEGSYSNSSVTTTNERFSRVGSSPADLHGMWYPTLRRTLMCLSKLYRCVDKAIFQGVSLEAVNACLLSLSSAGGSIAATSSPTHASLFQIKHLLILREQLAPFQVESILVETSLDWSKLKDAAYGLVQQRANLFSFGSNNAILQFIVEGTPNVTEHQMDSKRDVDMELKKVCEHFINTSTESLIRPLTVLLAKMDVILTMNQREEDIKPIQLKNQPFANPNNINELISNVNRSIRTKLPKLHCNLHLYLANRDTEFILLKPIRINVSNSFGRLTKILADHYNQDDAIIASCPTYEEINIIMNALLGVTDNNHHHRESSLSNDVASSCIPAVATPASASSTTAVSVGSATVASVDSATGVSVPYVAAATTASVQTTTLKPETRIINENKSTGDDEVLSNLHSSSASQNTSERNGENSVIIKGLSQSNSSIDGSKSNEHNLPQLNGDGKSPTIV